MYRKSMPRLAALLAVSATGSLIAMAGGPPPAAASASAGDRALLMLPGGTGTSLSAVTASVRRAGGHVLASYPVAGSVLADVPAGWSPPADVLRVSDRALHVSGTVGTTAASTVRATLGGSSPTAGAGLTVAVLDTGVANSPDLQGRLTHVNVTAGPAGDGYGHGTFMAGLIAGSGFSSDGKFVGVAPAAGILDVQVASATGETSLSQVLAGLQAVSDRHAVDPSLRVLNVSLSADSPVPPAFDPLARGLDALWNSGVTVVVAAGNDGPKVGTVTSPGDDPVLLTVGSLNEAGTADHGDDSVSDFSARGVTKGGPAKPDLVAPGAAVVSLRSPGSVIDSGYPSARVGESYFRGSGTSMAAAVTSGAAAALLTARTDLTPNDVKALLTGTAYRVSSSARGAGSGGLDLASALTARVPAAEKGRNTDSASPAWGAFGQAWASGNWEATARAWAQLSPSDQQWAARAWASRWRRVTLRTASTSRHGHGPLALGRLRLGPMRSGWPAPGPPAPGPQTTGPLARGQRGLGPLGLGPTRSGRPSSSPPEPGRRVPGRPVPGPASAGGAN
ncbi:MAG: S8 family serine peptidase [Frankiaceae bacterium]